MAPGVGHPARLTMTHTLSANAVELDAPSIEHFKHRDVEVEVVARVADDRTFATIICAGSVVIPPDPPPRGAGEIRYLAHENLSGEYQTAVNYASAAIEAALTDVGSVLRWRFGVFGADELWTNTELQLRIDGRIVEFIPVGRALLGHGTANIPPGHLGEVASLLDASFTQPLCHELWREAWNLQYSRPRSSLVLGVAAAEVGLKQLIAQLAPHAESLVEHMASPPLDVMIRKVMPDLPMKSGIDPSHRCPTSLRKHLVAAVEARNKVVHRGATPTLNLWRALHSIREFLYLLDLHAGHDWAESHLSDSTRAAIRPESRGTVDN